MHPTTDSEARRAEGVLLGRVADGDEHALAEVYATHAGPVMGLAVRMMGGRAEAEDLVHDVFVEAWRTAARYDPSRGSVRTWLLVKCRARALDRLRSPRLKRRVDGVTLVPDRGASERRSAERKSDTARAVSALSCLPAAQRAVLELSYFRGLSSSEIARELGIPIGTVKSRAAAGLRGLRRSLAGTPGPAARGAR